MGPENLEWYRLVLQKVKSDYKLPVKWKTYCGERYLIAQKEFGRDIKCRLMRVWYPGYR